MVVMINCNKIKRVITISLVSILTSSLFSCSYKNNDSLSNIGHIEINDETIDLIKLESSEDISEEASESTSKSLSFEEKFTTEKIYIDFSAPYATYSIINDGYAVLYKIDKSKVDNYKNKIVAVNAGHGTKGGANIKTFAHPDFSPKYTGGSNAAGSILSAAVTSGMTFENGMTEANANLVVAYALKDKLLDAGYSVLMIRENDDCRLDNIARTVIANTDADAHIAIHFDSTNSDKGIFYIVPYNDERYLNMEPLKSNYKNIKKLGDSVIESFREMGEKIWKDSGIMQGDLTQLSFSTNASIDIELGDRKTVLTPEKADTFAEGIKNGLDVYFTNQ